MPDSYVSDDLRSFILKRIDSVAQIESLLLIRADPASRWDAGQIAKRLYIGQTEASEVLDRLCAAGLLVCADGIYRLDGVLPENRQMIDELLEVYSRHLIPVTNIVHSKPHRIESFADAFKFRKGS
jgi:hypothetical protein